MALNEVRFTPQKRTSIERSGMSAQNWGLGFDTPREDGDKGKRGTKLLEAASQGGGLFFRSRAARGVGGWVAVRLGLTGTFCIVRPHLTNNIGSWSLHTVHWCRSS
jgi:hypothetical protein